MVEESFQLILHRCESRRITLGLCERQPPIWETPKPVYDGLGVQQADSWVGDDNSDPGRCNAEGDEIGKPEPSYEGEDDFGW